MKRFAKTAIGACVALVVLAVCRYLFPGRNFQVAAALAFIAIIIGIPLYKRVYSVRQEREEG